MRVKDWWLIEGLKHLTYGCSHLQFIVTQEPRSFFIPYGTYQKEYNRQLYVSSDVRDPLTTTSWFLVGQAVREHDIENILECGCTPPAYSDLDALILDEMGGTADLLAMTEEEIAREPELPPSAQGSDVDLTRLGTGYRPEAQERASPFNWTAQGSEE